MSVAFLLYINSGKNEAQVMDARISTSFTIIFNDENGFHKSCQKICENLQLFTGRWVVDIGIGAYGRLQYCIFKFLLI